MVFEKTFAFTAAVGVFALIGYLIFIADGCEKRSIECRERAMKACLEHHGSECSLAAQRVCSASGAR